MRGSGESAATGRWWWCGGQFVALAVAVVGALLARLAGGSAVWWIAPAIVAFGACVAAGIGGRGGQDETARILDHDLGLRDQVSTALELEREGGERRGLVAMVIADGRAAVGRSLASAHVAGRPGGFEWAALAVCALALAAVLLVPSIGGGSGSGQSAARANGASQVASGASGSGNLNGGKGLSGFKSSLKQPRINAVAPGQTRSGGALSGHSPYGAGIAAKNPQGDIAQSNRSLGPDTSAKSAQAASQGAGGASEGHAAGGGKAVAVTGPQTATKGSASVGGAAGNTLGGGGGQSGGKQPNAHNVQAGNKGGNSPGGAGASGNGSGGQQQHSGKAGGGTAGGTRGTTQQGTGLVPQLGFGGKLPIQPGYAPSAAGKSSAGEGSSQALNGGGGASRVGTAGAGSGGVGKNGIHYVPPGGGAVGGADRELLLGYFGGFGRITAAGW